MRYLKEYTRLLVLLALLGAVFAPSLTSATQDEALQYYHKGIAAQTIGEREQYFEKALELYIARFNTMKESGKLNGLLCYNIGNCYFNLQQNEEAIFYYQLGKKLLPSNSKIQANLTEALAKRSNGVDIENGGPLENLLFFHYKLGPASQINLLIAAAMVAAISLLWLIMRANITAKYTAILSAFTVIALLTSLAVNYYMPIHIGIMMKSSDIRRGPDRGFAPITSRPLGGGSSIKVLSLSEGWYLVKLNDGRQGFIEQESIKIVVI